MWARLSGSPPLRHPQPLAADSAAALGARRHASPTSQGRHCSTPERALPKFAAAQALEKISTEKILHDRRLHPVRRS
jgi:hypothetical protein